MDIQKIGVIGGGMIGASMASLFIGHGYNTVLIEREGFTHVAEKNVDAVYSDLEAHGMVTNQQVEICKSYLQITSDYAALKDVDFIFECVFERTPIKHAAYAQIEQHCSKLRAIASSTSAISADELAEGLNRYKDCLVVAHPWNPPHLAPCVEIVGSRHTSQDAISLVNTLLTKTGKETVVLDRNYPGFIGNRLQYAMLREAIHMVEEGVATPEDIDRTIKYSFAPRYTTIGLFEHFDNCGQDLTMDICNYLFPSLCDAKAAQPSLVSNCAEGNLGIKSGKGMLNWANRDINEFRSLAASPYYRFFHWNLPTKKAD